MPSLLNVLSVVLLSLTGVAYAGSACVAFDISWNLLAFGFNGKDYNAGTQESWASGTASDITTQGRPPFNGANATCLLSEFTNAIYVLGADSANPLSIYIYDATAKSWSTQVVTTSAGFDPSNFGVVLDHDTNFLYALSNGNLFNIDMELLKSANATAKTWAEVQQVAFATDAYQPVMALAQNHIYFFDVPGLPNGSAQIFVIHFSFLQPQAQSYGTFPNTHGRATSFFMDSGVQEEMVFIPDDGSATYVINVQTNTTQTLKGPDVKDPLATYFASTTSLVQLSSSGSVSYLPYDPSSPSANAAATWNVITTLPKIILSSSTSVGSTTSTKSQSQSGSATGSNAGQSASATGGSKSSAVLVESLGIRMIGAVVIAVCTVLLL